MIIAHVLVLTSHVFIVPMLTYMYIVIFSRNHGEITTKIYKYFIVCECQNYCILLFEIWYYVKLLKSDFTEDVQHSLCLVLPVITYKPSM